MFERNWKSIVTKTIYRDSNSILWRTILNIILIIVNVKAYIKI